jgi:dipeptide/tripeptide permease
MLGSIVRVLIGFAVSCVAAGLTLVLFVTTPVELASTPSDTAMDVLTSNGMLALAVATHGAVFAAPFALIGAAIGEWRGIAHWTYYVLVGIAIATLGFLAQHLSEGIGDPSILNNYALAAFLTTGFVSGMVYWLLSGQFASGNQDPQTPEIIKPRSDAKAPPPRPVPSKS